MAIRILDRSGAPEKYWIFVVLLAAQIINHTAHSSLNWTTPYEKTHGETPDISVFWSFKFWQKIRYLIKSAKFPENKAKPGRWIGIDWQSGDHMTYKILPEDPNASENGRIILTRSVIEPDDESNLRCNSEREKGWETHRIENTMPSKGTRKSPRLNPEENEDLEEFHW